MSYFNIILLSVFTLFFAACEKTGNLSQERERARLENLYQEIDSLATRFQCENAEEWEFIAIGSKACGGPTGYIAYSIHLDTDAFIEKVKLYTQLQDLYNKKWRIVSDCMALLPPDDIECVDGKPKFVYNHLTAR